MRLPQMMISLMAIFSVVTASASAEVQIENCQQTQMEVDQEIPYLYLFEVQSAEQQTEILAAVSKLSTLTVKETKHFKTLNFQMISLAPNLDESGSPYTDLAIQAEVRAMIQAAPITADVIYSCNHIMHGAPKAGGAN